MNLAVFSSLFFKHFFLHVACFLPGKAVYLFEKKKKVGEVTVEQGTQLYFKDFKSYIVLHTLVSAPIPNSSVTANRHLRSRPEGKKKERKKMIHDTIFV